MEEVINNMKCLSIFAAFALIAAAYGATGPKVTDHVYFDMEIGGEKVGRLVFGLFGNTVEKTAENFRKLCTHETEGFDGRDGGYGYTDSIFHRIIPGFMAQGGDFENSDGTGGSGWNSAKFKDENFKLNHVARGYLSMANAGPHTNGSQFFILFTDTPWLNGRHVVFGKVVEGMDILDKLEAVKTSSSDRPQDVVKVVKSGALELAEPYNLEV